MRATGKDVTAAAQYILHLREKKYPSPLSLSPSLFIDLHPYDYQKT
jgi:hypothetical protein